MAAQPEVRYINAYVSGNVVKQPEKMPQKKSSVQLPKIRRKQRLVIPVDVVALGGIVAAVVLAVMLITSVVQMSQAKQEAKQLQAYSASLEQENAQLRDTYTSSYDQEEVRQIAQTIGMVPAEQVQHHQVQVVEPAKTPEPTALESFWTFVVGMFA